MPSGIKKMNLKNKILFSLTRKILERNKRFHNIHLGETCYLFGNGASLKNMDLAKFSDKISIGCNFLVLHKGFEKLNCLYYTLAEPFFSYPLYKNPYAGKIEFNYLGKLFKRSIAQQKRILLFTNISNLGGFWGNNYFYFYHFGEKNSLEHFDLSANFGYGAGALYSMIGLAIYMGFKKAILVGCDYTFFSCNSGHFYSKSSKIRGDNYQKKQDNPFVKLFKHIELITITENRSRSDLMNFIEYTDFIGAQPVWKDNHELVEPEYLQILRKAYFAGQYTNPID